MLHFIVFTQVIVLALNWRKLIASQTRAPCGGKSANLIHRQ